MLITFDLDHRCVAIALPKFLAGRGVPACHRKLCSMMEKLHLREVFRQRSNFWPVEEKT